MTTDPVVIESGASLETADLVLRSTFIKGIPVVDDQGRLVGTISHAHLAAHRFAEVDRNRAEIESVPAERTEQTD
jgi:CBS domain-containing protein